MKLVVFFILLLCHLLTTPVFAQSRGVSYEEYAMAADFIEGQSGLFYDERWSDAKIVVNRTWRPGAIRKAYAYDLIYGSSPSEFNKNFELRLHLYLVKNPWMNYDALILAHCTALSWSLGEEPRGDSDGSSLPGQAIYSAAGNCARNVWDFEDNDWAISQLRVPVPSTLTKACSQSRNHARERSLCIRIGMAALQLTRALADIEGVSAPSFETPSAMVVDESLKLNPSVQCQLDTYLQGALCNKFSNGKISCEGVEGEVGARPRCWYAPVR